MWKDNEGAFIFFGEAFLMIALLIAGIIQLINIGVMVFKKTFEFERLFLTAFNVGLLSILFFTQIELLCFLK